MNWHSKWGSNNPCCLHEGKKKLRTRHMHTQSKTFLHHASWFLCMQHIFQMLFFLSCDENNAMVFNFVNFDEIGVQFKGNLERDCKCEIGFWGIAILNISWKTLKWWEFPNNFKCISNIAKLHSTFLSHVGPQQVWLKTRTPQILPCLKLLCMDMVSSFKIVTFV